jgi:hypothetical protein
MDSILLISANPADLDFTQQIAQIVGMEVKHTPGAQEGAFALQEGTFRAVFVDASTEEIFKEVEAQFTDKVGLFSDKLNSNVLHFITNDTIDTAPYLAASPLFGHLLLRKFKETPGAVEQYSRVLKATLKDRAFGLDLLLKPGTRIQKFKLVDTAQKQDAVNAIRNFLLQAKFQSRIATLIANAIDEILMNAMFDAPVDALGKQIHSNVSRSASFKLEGKAEVEVSVGFDGAYVGVTAIDHFGSLEKDRLMSHVSKAYTEEEYKVKASVAGAGLGLATVYRTGGSFFFASEKGTRTEVTVFFRLAENYRQFKEQFRFFSTQFYF